MSVTFVLVVLVIAAVGVVTLLASRKMEQWRSIPFRRMSDSDVFLSYKSDDATIVRFLAEQMIARGLNVWFNEYRIILRGWESEFAVALDEGVAAARRAAFFTNADWAKSSWCVDTEARPLIERLGVGKCVEVRIPPHDTPHRALPDLSGVQQITTDGGDRWRLLTDLLVALGYVDGTQRPSGPQKRPFRHKVNSVPYGLNVGDWTVRGAPYTSNGSLVLPRLERRDNGTCSSVHIIAGKRGWERKQINDLDDRRTFQNLRDQARKYFEIFPLAAECVGVHLVFHSGLSHGAFTYWGKSAWCRKYAIVLPAQDGGADIEFTFTCSIYGSFSEFCRLAYQFDDLVASLWYGWPDPVKSTEVER